MNSLLASIGLASLTAFVSVLGVLAAALRWGTPARILDHPNQRSLHQGPVPRIGGVAIAVGTALGVLVTWAAGPDLFWFAVSMVFIVSLIDDARSLSAMPRIIVHFAAAGVLVAAYSPAEAVWLLPALLSLVWMTNLFNFMDGSDGLAGGMAIIGLGSLGFASWTAGHLEVALPAFVLASASLAFLVFNFAPAQIFLGDAGSAPLGFAAGGLGLVGVVEGTWPVWFPILVFSPFVVDATATLLTRLVRGENVLKPHREHHYQRLIRAGWGHRRTALAYYAIMAAAGSSAMWLLQQPPAIVARALGAWLLIYLASMFIVNRIWRAHRERESDICPV